MDQISISHRNEDTDLPAAFNDTLTQQVTLTLILTPTLTKPNLTSNLNPTIKTPNSTVESRASPKPAPQLYTQSRTLNT